MDDLDRLSLKSLRTVETVARLGTLGRAAQALGVSTGAVSQQIARIEDTIGRPLFDRTPRGMLPRAEAADLFDALEGGFARIGAALARLQRQRQDVVTISVAPIFAARWLVWRLPDFHARHPGIKVRIESESRLADPRREDLDFCLRIGRGPWPGLEVEPLFDQRVVPVCAPTLAARLTQPADLAQVPIIREPGAMFDWSTWLDAEGVDPAQLGDGPDFPDASMCLDAAIAGLGVFLAFEILVTDQLRFGRLATPFPRYRTTGHRYVLVRAPDRSLPPPARHFRAWLKAALIAEGLGDGPPMSPAQGT